MQGVYQADLAKTEPERVLFFDMGSASTWAALVEYTTIIPPNAVGLERSGVAHAAVTELSWDAELGGDDFEMALVEHLAGRFNEDNAEVLDGADVRDDPKAMYRLQQACRKAKEVLSANQDTTVYIDEFFRDQALAYPVSRDDLDALVGPLLERAAATVRAVVDRSGVDVSQLANVELLGGGSRVPAVIAAVQDALGGAELSRHLDSDEAVVWGAAVAAYNATKSSHGFRLKTILATEGSPLGYSLVLRHPEDGSVMDTIDVAPRMHPLATGKDLYAKIEEPVEGTVLELVLGDGPDGEVLPLDMPERVLGRWTLSGVDAARESYGEENFKRVVVVLKHDHGGLIDVEGGFAWVRVTETRLVDEWVEEEVPVEVEVKAEGSGESEDGGEGDDTDGSDTGESGSAGSDGEGEEKGRVYADEGDEKEGGVKTVTRRVKKTVERQQEVSRKVPVTLDGGFVSRHMADDEAATVSARFAAIEEREAVKRRVMRLQHLLETELFYWTDALDAGGEVEEYASEEERESILEYLAELDEWFYDEGMYSDDVAVLEGKLGELHGKVAAVRQREEAAVERESAEVRKREEAAVERESAEVRRWGWGWVGGRI